MCDVVKYDRRGYKPRARTVVVTKTDSHFLTKEGKTKETVPHSELQGNATPH